MFIYNSISTFYTSLLLRLHLFTVIYNVQHWDILLHARLNYLSYIQDTQVLSTVDDY